MRARSFAGTLMEAARALDIGRIGSRDLVEMSLEQIANSPNARAAYLLVDEEGARSQADAADQDRRHGYRRSLLQGIPISIKDLFDVEGQVTTAGSTALAGRSAAPSDAECLRGLRQAGMVFLGRTHMTEFAYSGLGLNAHFADPASIWQDQGRRVPGGSSSGAAVSVAEAAAIAAIGTDTGGSCRIPSAFNRLVGFKPTARRVPSGGCFPLSPSLDSIGPIGRSVECCAILDRLMAANWPTLTVPIRKRLLLPTNVMLDGMDSVVGAEFERAIGRLEGSGFEIVRARVPAFDMLPELTSQGGLVAIEAYGLHQAMIAEADERYDPRTLTRIRMGAEQSPGKMQDLVSLRRRFVAAMEKESEDYDCIVAPTVPIIPPTIESCMTEPSYSQNNLMVLRNPSIANLMDGCSMSLPIGGSSDPISLMIMSHSLKDGAIIKIGRIIESILKMEDA